MLLVLPVPLWLKGEQIFFESQACNGLERWADNFGKVVVAAPAVPDQEASQFTSLVWQDTRALTQDDRVQFVPLPWGYSLGNFFKHYTRTRRILAGLIRHCQYLQFAIGGLVGDWAAVAAVEAYRQQRPYAIHTDRVEHQVILEVSRNLSLPGRLKANLIALLMEYYHRWIIRRCGLGLWHGEDCYAAYGPLCSNSHLIHDIHTKPEDAITLTEATAKVQQSLDDPTLRICYAGRMDAMKAPVDWVKAIARARDQGVTLHAIWMGDGSLRQEMEAEIARSGLKTQIELMGFVRDRSLLLQKLKESHLMLFTHVTPESPRCLIEALICGTPIVGYHSSYAENLLGQEGGGLLVPVRDWQTLGDTLVKLAHDRQHLSQLIQAATQTGSHFNDQAVFYERSQLIKQHLA